MKIFILLSTIAVATFAAPQGVTSPHKMLILKVRIDDPNDIFAPKLISLMAEMIMAGVSNEAAGGIINIWKSHAGEFQDVDGMAAEKVKNEVDMYIKTQSEADQAAYGAFVEKKKVEWKAQESV